MEETRLCKLIKAMSEAKYNLSKMYNGDGLEALANQSMAEHMMLDKVYRILTDNDFAEQIAKIYNI